MVEITIINTFPTSGKFCQFSKLSKNLKFLEFSEFLQNFKKSNLLPHYFSP